MSDDHEYIDYGPVRMNVEVLADDLPVMHSALQSGITALEAKHGALTMLAIKLRDPIDNSIGVIDGSIALSHGDVLALMDRVATEIGALKRVAEKVKPRW